MVITDDSGPISLAGVMGGATTEIRPGSDPIDVVLRGGALGPGRRSRAAPAGTSCPARRPRRFERGVDPQLPPVAAERAARAAGRARRRHDRGRPHRRRRRPADRARCGWRWTCPTGSPAWRYPTGRDGPSPAARWAARSSSARAPTARPGRRDAADLAARPGCSPPTWSRRCCGWRATTTIPSRCPPRRAGRGLTPAQRRRRSVSGALAEAGYVEVLPFPFVGPADVGRARAARRRPPPPRRAGAQPARRRPRRAAHHAAAGPARHARPQPVARGRATSRCTRRARSSCRTASSSPLPEPGVDDRPSDAEMRRRSTPRCRPSRGTSAWCWPATGSRAAGGGAGRPASWADAVEAARLVGGGRAAWSCGSPRATTPPWHPGRCADAAGRRLRRSGYAGELHPKVVDALGLPPRTCAMELDLDLAARCVDDRPAPLVSPYPPVAGGRGAGRRRPRCPPAELADALLDGGGDAAGGRAAVRRLHRRAGRARATGRWPTRCASGRRTAR